MTEKAESGVDQEVATASPPLINSKNHRPGRELDALIAHEVFGAFGFENIDVINGTPNELFAVLPGNRAVNRVPYFSTDIAAVWGVVEEFRRGGWTFEFNNQDPHGQHAMFWQRYARADGVGASAETAPLAICLAALRALDALAPVPAVD